MRKMQNVKNCFTYTDQMAKKGVNYKSSTQSIEKGVRIIVIEHF